MRVHRNFSDLVTWIVLSFNGSLRAILGRKTRPADASFRLSLRRLGRGDFAIDCGAKIGKYTQFMAWTGAQIYAFEPNPFAYDVLSRRFSGRSNVVCLNKAVGGTAGIQKLYLDARAGSDPLRYATGSSLLSFKRNVDPEKFVNVEVVDLLDFIRSIGGRVGLIKMDVEGAEIEILERMLATENSALEIGRLFVEMHDQKIPELAKRGEIVRSEIARRGMSWIDLSWH